MGAAPARRYRLKTEVMCKRSYNRHQGFGNLRDISRTGAFVETTQEVNPGDKITIEFSVSAYIRKISAKVIWCGRGGCGVQFEIKNNRDQKIIDDLISVVDECQSLQKEVLNGIFGKLND